MNYTFECKNKECTDVNKLVIIPMRITEYKADGHYCEKCGMELGRTIESLVCGYVNDKDFYGKSSK